MLVFNLITVIYTLIHSKMKSYLTVQKSKTVHQAVNFVKPVHTMSCFLKLKPKDKYPESPFLFCNNCFCIIFGASNPALLSAWRTSWRRLWRSTIRGNLKMVITELMCRTAVCKVLVLRRSVFWGLLRLSLLFPDVLWGFQEPEEEFLSTLLFDDVELVVVPQSTGHFLIGHIVSVLVVSPETSQPIGINHPEHQAVLVLPSDVFLVTVITQQLIHVVPQQSALWDAAVSFVQWAPRFLPARQVERLLDDALCLGSTLNLFWKRCRDSCWSIWRVLDCGRLWLLDIVSGDLVADCGLDVSGCQGRRRLRGVTDNTPPLLFHTL